MTESHTRGVRDAEALISQLWQRECAKSGEVILPSFSFEEIIQEFDGHNNQRSLPELEFWLAIFDQFAAWYVSFAISGFVAGRNLNSKSTRLAAYVLLMGYVISQHAGIRRLVCVGLDIQAKQLVRALAEHLDLCMLLALKPELADDFLETDRQETANRFWFQNMAKRKARKFINNSLVKAIGDAAVTRYSDWRTEEDNVLSMAIHPTFMSCTMAGAPESDENPRDWIGWFGFKTENSVRTLRYAILASVEFLAVGYPILFDDNDERLFDFREKDEFNRHMKYGRNVLIDLTKFILLRR